MMQWNILLDILRKKLIGKFFKLFMMYCYIMEGKSDVNPLSTEGDDHSSKSPQVDFELILDGKWHLEKRIKGYVGEGDETKVTSSSICVPFPEDMQRAAKDMQMILSYPNVIGSLAGQEFLVWLIVGTGNSFNPITGENITFLRCIGKKVKSLLKRSGIDCMSSLKMGKTKGGVHLDVLTRQKTGPQKSIVKKRYRVSVHAERCWKPKKGKYNIFLSDENIDVDVIEE